MEPLGETSLLFVLCSSLCLMIIIFSTGLSLTNFSSKCRLTQFFLRERTDAHMSGPVAFGLCARSALPQVHFPLSMLGARKLYPVVEEVCSRLQENDQSEGNSQEEGDVPRETPAFHHLSERHELGREQKKEMTSRYVLSQSRSFCRPRMAMENWNWSVLFY